MNENGRRFERLWAATVTSNLGDGMVVAAFPLLAATLTRDPMAVSLLTAAAGLPWLLFGPIAGAIVDRRDRRRIMWVFDLARAIVAALLALFIGFGGQSLAALYLVVALISLGETLVDTSSQAILPALVGPDRLDRANGRLFSTMTVANRFIGPPLGGFLFGLAALLPVAADAVSFAVAAVLVMSIPGRYRPRGSPEIPVTTVWASVGEGLRWLWATRPIRTFAIGAALLNVGILAGESLLVLFAQDQLGLGATAFGALFLASAAGYSAGSSAAPFLVSRISRHTLVLSAIALAGLSVLAIGVAGDWPLAATGLLGVGAASGVWDVIAVSYRQAAVPDRLLGRTMAAYRVIAHGSIPIGAFMGGFVARAMGTRSAFVVGALIVFAAAPLVVIGLRGVELDPARLRV